MDLFLDNPKGLQKFAAAFTRLSENPDDWQSEIMNELYRQAPYVGDFDPKIVINELDPERRYAIGAVEVTNKLAVNPLEYSVSSGAQGMNLAMIPIIVNEGKMSPLDTFIQNGKAQPLTEDRIKRAMFRPQVFEAAAERPGDQDMLNILYPPYRSGGFGLGNARVGQLETPKTSSVRPEFLVDVIRETVKEADVEKLETALNEDKELRYALLDNDATRGWLAKLAIDHISKKGNPKAVKLASAEDMLKEALHAIPPKVIQITKVAGGFRIKTANSDNLLPQEEEVDRPTAMGTVGSDVVNKVERNGTVTISTNPAVKDTLDDATVKVVDEFGEYKVKTQDGKELVGWVFPNCLDLDGHNLAIAVFSNGSESAFQEDIAGSLVGKGSNLIDEDPKGFGCFYLARGGSAIAMVPMTIMGVVQGPDGKENYHAQTIMGAEVQVQLVPGLQEVSPMSESVFAIPEDCGWMPMREMTELASDPGEFGKTAEAQRLPHKVEVMWESGGTYSMRGQLAEKLAQVLPCKFINHDQAMFNLAILGVEPEFARTKLASAKKLSRWCSIDGVRPVTFAAEKYAEAEQRAGKYIERLPKINVLMLKEAASLDDPLSVDRVLSIGFLNPENVSTFVSYLPEFEDTLNRLSELLIAARLGLSNVDVGALERVTRHLDKVIDGLRELTQHPAA